MYKSKAILVENFETLVAAVDSSQLQLSFEGLGIEETEVGEMNK